MIAPVFPLEIKLICIHFVFCAVFADDHLHENVTGYLNTFGATVAQRIRVRASSLVISVAVA